MSHVLVVARNANVGVGLVHLGYDVIDVRPDRHGDWTHEAAQVNAVILELSDAVAAESAVLRLRDEGYDAPVLIVSNATPGWDVAAEHMGPGTTVLALPISLPKLQAALDPLIAGGPIDLTPQPRNEAELLDAVAASVGLAISETGTVVADHGQPKAARHLAPGDPSSPAPEPETAPEHPAPVPPVQPARAALPRPAPAPMPEPPPAPRPGEGRSPAHDSYVDTLLAWASDLTGVAECAEVVVAELADRIGAEAVALLLPDGAEWRVSGGSGLRALEHRVRLAEDHWLVQHVVVKGEGMLADDTDAVRDELIGAPLASWQRVLAVPVPEVRGLFVAGRAGEAFGEDALTTAVAVGVEAAPLLADALRVRTLARALAPYAETDDDA